MDLCVQSSALSLPSALVLPIHAVSCSMSWTLFLPILMAFVGCICPGRAENSHETKAFVIVGAGPAGIQWGKLLEEAGETNFVILERNEEAGSFFQQYPRARKLISTNRAHMPENKSAEYGLRHDWHSLLSTKSFAANRYSTKWNPTAQELVNYLQDVAAGLPIRYNTTVLRTEYKEKEQVHAVHTTGGDMILGEYLIIATGMRVRDVPKCLTEHAAHSGTQVFSYETYPNVVAADEAFCRGKRVVVLGSGNAAFETADLISPCAASLRLFYKNKPRFSYITHYVGDVRVTNAGILDRYQLKSLDDVTEHTVLTNEVKMKLTESEAARIRVEGLRTALVHHSQEWLDTFNNCTSYAVALLDYDVAVFAGGFTGHREGLVDLEDEKQRFPKVGQFWSDPAVPRKFFAGNLMHGADYRRSAGGFIHGFRYSIRAQFRHIMRERKGRLWRAERPNDLEEALSVAVRRVQESSGLYQMQDFLIDVISMNADGSVEYLEELPEPWVDEHVPNGGRLEVKFVFSNKDVWTHELNFDPSHILRTPALFLHPVITPVYNGLRLKPCHAREDLRADWTMRSAVVDLFYCLIIGAVRLTAAQDGQSHSELDMERHALAYLDSKMSALSTMVNVTEDPKVEFGPSGGPRLTAESTATAKAEFEYAVAQ